MSLLIAAAVDEIGLRDVVIFRGGYNTNVVLVGTLVLGLACGVIGGFLLLRRRSLVADALSHAALPGVCFGFLLAVWLGGDGKSLWALLPGAALFGLLGVGFVQLLMTLPRIKEDAAIGVVLSVFFAVGIVLLSVIQNMNTGSQAGLSRFIFGQAATMRIGDSQLIAVMALLLLIVTGLAYKELRLLCFDPGFARGLGWSTLVLDGMLLFLVTMITVAGLHAVGAVLMVALLIIPPVTAQFWTTRFNRVLIISAVVGAAGCFLGTVASALIENLPTGPAIVLACSLLFVASLLVAPRRSLVSALRRRIRLARMIGREHVLRAVYECGEIAGSHAAPVSLASLLDRRTWHEGRVHALLRGAVRRGEIERSGDDAWVLTDDGLAAARQIVRGHRLWEYYLLTHAGIAPSHVDRDADDIEHVLGESLVNRLEEALRSEGALPADAEVPSLHALANGAESRKPKAESAGP